MTKADNVAPLNPLGGYAKPIVLVGLMGAGKSTIGRRFAETLGWDFVDSDDEIVEAAGCSIADIFEIYGETIFRDLEHRVIKRLLETERTVIATGGGAWIQPGVRSLIKRHAVSVWLSADLDTLTDRVSRRTHRPLLETGDKREILKKLLNDRSPIYAEADLSIDSGLGNHHKVVEELTDKVAAFVK